MRKHGISPDRFARDPSGASAVEFAVLVPVYLFMLLAMLAYAIYFGAAHSIQQLAADAARTSIAGLNEAERNSLVADFITRNASDYTFIEPEAISYDVGDKPEDPSQYRVTLAYDASSLPIWGLWPDLPLPGKTITYTSTIRHGGI